MKIEAKPIVAGRRAVVRALAAAPLAALLGSRFAPAASAASNGANDAGSAAKDAPTYRIEIHDFAFAPKALTVPAGARIIWVNRDDEPHTIVSAAGAFKPSHALDTGDSFAAVLRTPGTYGYFCGIHPMMVGTIVVR